MGASIINQVVASPINFSVPVASLLSLMLFAETEDVERRKTTQKYAAEAKQRIKVFTLRMKKEEIRFEPRMRVAVRPFALRCPSGNTPKCSTASPPLGCRFG